MKNARERFIAHLQKRFGLSPSKAAEWLTKIREEKIKHGTVLLRPGQKVQTNWFVAEGCLRSYIIDGKGKEHILQFAPEEWIVGDIYGLLSESPASYFVDAIEDSVVFRFDQNMLALAENHKAIDTMLPIVKSHHTTQQRLIGILSKTAEERYRDFIRTYPSLAQRLPLSMIASYIGITPQSLSRIRHKLAGKK